MYKGAEDKFVGLGEQPCSWQSWQSWHKGIHQMTRWLNRNERRWDTELRWNTESVPLSAEYSPRHRQGFVNQARRDHVVGCSWQMSAVPFVLRWPCRRDFQPHAWRWCWGCCNACTGEMPLATMVYTFHAPETKIRPPDGFATMTLSTCHPVKIFPLRCGSRHGKLAWKTDNCYLDGKHYRRSRNMHRPSLSVLALNYRLWIVWPWLRLDTCTICTARFWFHGHSLRY